MSDPQRLKVKSDGTATGTKIFLPDGTEIAGVTSVEMGAVSARTRFATVTVVCRAELDYEAEAQPAEAAVTERDSVPPLGVIVAAVIEEIHRREARSPASNPVPLRPSDLTVGGM